MKKIIFVLNSFLLILLLGSGCALNSQIQKVKDFGLTFENSNASFLFYTVVEKIQEKCKEEHILLLPVFFSYDSTIQRNDAMLLTIQLVDINRDDYITEKEVCEIYNYLKLHPVKE